jgi:hypothetical protein
VGGLVGHGGVMMSALVGGVGNYGEVTGDGEMKLVVKENGGEVVVQLVGWKVVGDTW